MACNQRRGHLDKSTRNHLSALDAYIAEQAEANKPKQPDEFTLFEFGEKLKAAGVVKSESALNQQLKRMMEEKIITSRKMGEGRVKRLYKFL